MSEQYEEGTENWDGPFLSLVNQGLTLHPGQWRP